MRWVALLALAACSTDLGRYPLVTSKTSVPMPPYTVVQQGIEITSCAVAYNAYQIPITPESIIAFAIDRVGGGANALVDARVQRTIYPFGAVLWPRECMTVRGDAVRIGPAEESSHR